MKPRTFKIVLLLLGFLCLSGCQDTSQPYVVIHVDGRVWELDFEPYQGGVTGLRGWWDKYIQFRNADGFTCAILPGNCKVMTASVFEKLHYDPDIHHYTYEHVWEN